ncbi:MAG TPA: hypothetical protein VFP87_13070, partial [Chitinophagaceae bacterium]|nr:hypothetical protein [Chitinophagaceae bacterium]
MKNLYLFVLILAFPFSMLAQNLHGLWSGTMVNDTLRVTQNFEFALSEYRGKITGYTYQTYIIRDTFYYSVKRVKAERVGAFLQIEDVERIGDNFPDKAAKKVHMTINFPLINDTTIDFLKGHWSTNQTKVYYSVGGDMKLKEQEDEKQSDLLAHLQELNVNTNVAIYQKEDRKQQPVVKNSPPAKRQQNKDNGKVAQGDNKDVAKSQGGAATKNKTTAVVTDTKKEQSTEAANTTQPSTSTGDKTVAQISQSQSQDPPRKLPANKESKIISNNTAVNENKVPVQDAIVKQEPA